MLGHFVKDSQLLDQILGGLFLTVLLTAVVFTEIFHCDVILTADVKISRNDLFKLKL